MAQISVNRKFTLDVLLFGIFLLLVLLLRVGIGLAFPNILWPDEIFQSLEQAHRLTYGYGIVPWEFRNGTRSWVFPGILSGVMYLTAWMGEGSSGYLAGVTIFLCLISLIPILVAFLWGYRTGGLVAGIITGGVCSVWFESIYFAPKAFSEVVAAHLLLPGVYLGVCGKSFQPRTRLFLVGLLCGVALALRIHLLPAIAVAVWFICRKDWRSRGIPMIAGILGPILAFGVVDAFTWSYPFQSFWQNIWVNVAEGKSHEYGVTPWFAYLKQPVNHWSFALVPILFLAVLGTRRSPVLAWMALTIVLSHSVLAHKEYRFIYPAVLMAIVLAGLGTAELVARWRSRWSSPRGAIVAVLVCLILWTSTSAVLASRFETYRKNNLSMLWAAAETTNWQRYSGSLHAFKKLSTDETLCGVGLRAIEWIWSGGYTYLHRNVPIVLVDRDSDYDRLAPNFNYLVSLIPVPPQYQYVLQQCWGTTCLYKRSGSCTKETGYDINQLLEQKGE
jgi:hypothetical protein